MKIGILVKLGVFFAVAGLFAIMELGTLTGPHTGTTHTYYAMFGGPDGVSGLHDGNPVRVSGVAVGKVTSVDLVSATTAKVTFTANENQQITAHTWALVRYANLLGQRYLALTRAGDPNRPGAVLAPGGTIPATRTRPALSLTDLFNGFRPLFNALTPQQVNELSQEIIAVLQGQTGRIGDLIAQTADLTSNLAQRDDTFRTVLDSLSQLLGTVAQHDNQLADGVRALHALTEQLHADGPAILDSLGSVDRLASSVTGLLRGLQRHNLAADAADAASVTGVLARHDATLRQFVQGFYKAFGTFSRVSQNGNWLNVYLCNLDLQTYGKTAITGKDFTDSLSELLGGGSLSGLHLGGLVKGLLGGIPLSKLSFPVPLKLPTGHVGTGRHTAVCS
jgi:phospholipid/cholesterol/gamma-HCH transport system substrate-binding protein